MQDHRIDKLAQTLIHHSCRLQSGQKVLIEAFDLPEPALVCRLVEEAGRIGAIPHVVLKSNTVLRSIYRSATEAGMQMSGQFEAAVMKEMDAYIGIRGAA
ncbi:MAG: aminopeptidase, partial [Phycisphaerae bacterium]